MPKGIGLGAGVAHQYDANLLTNSKPKDNNSNATNDVFHNHSSNVPHLKTWIDQLVDLTVATDANANKNISTSGIVQHPTTENLVQAMQRYNVVFQELLKQVSIFSNPVSQVSQTVTAIFTLSTHLLLSI